MTTIYKYPLGPINDSYIVSLPVGAQILTAAIQNDNLTIWARVDPEMEATNNRIVRVYGTGHPIDKHDAYINTVFDGPFVWHVFVKV